ncbi:MAG: T9SS type A sorting domain-containing protein [Bacteroidetes bacterium]|nr:T9SS type A sorting domain-containing protein [Bacteroidota bacterium]
MKTQLNRLLIVFLIAIFYARQCAAQVSVSATAGSTTGQYATLNAAFAAINTGTHQGMIHISITGNTTEPSPPTSLVGSGTGGANYASIHISPSGGNWTIHSSAIPFAYRGIIELNGAKHVTIDGDPSGTGTAQLSFEMVKTSNVEVSVIKLSSADTSGNAGASFDTISGCNIIGGMDSATSTVLNYGIVCTEGSSTTTQGAGAYGCDYNVIAGNHFTRSYYCIYLNGPLSHPTSGGDKNILIKRNTFSSGYSDSSFAYGVFIRGFCVLLSADQSLVLDSNDFISDNPLAPTCIYEENMTGPIVFSNNHFQGTLRPVVAYPQLGTGYFRTTHSCYCTGNILENSNSAAFFFIYDYNPYDTIYILGNHIRNISVRNGGSVINTQGCTSYIEGNVIENITAQQGGITAINVSTTTNGNTNINGNTIRGLVCLGVNQSSWIWSGAAGIGVGGRSSVTNNMISGLSCLVSHQGWNAVGMFLDSGVSCTNNTVVLNTPIQQGSDSTGSTYCIYSVGIHCTFRDNIMVNLQDQCVPYGLYLDGTTYSTDTSDYNNIYVPHGNVGFAGSVRPSLLHWQAALAQDLHSISQPVPFKSTTDLHVDTLASGAYSVFRSGISTSNTTDIDGQTRSNPPCLGADEFRSFVSPPDSLVWPGDADASHMVDNTDLLPIGLAYDSTGPTRATQSILWQGYASVDWADSFSSYTPAINYKHADCNGDGVINADDTTAIIQNFSLTHAKTNGPQPSRSGIPELNVLLSADTSYTGDTLTVSFLLGDSLLSASDIYGLAFTYNFDPSVVDSTFTTMTFGFSWLGNTDKITLSKTLNAIGQIKAAVTRIDHVTRSGYGPIATARFKITTDNISGKDYSYYANVGYISDITAIDAQGNAIQLNAGADTSQVAYEPTGIREIATANIRLYPNPANNKLTITADDVITAVSVTNAAGQEVYQQKAYQGKNMEISLADGITDGIYFVHVKTKRAAGITKLSVIR